MNTRMHHPVGAVSILAVFLLLSLPTLGEGRSRVVAASPPSSELQLHFVTAPAGIADAGTIVWRGGSRRSTVSVMAVRMRIGAATPEARGTATVRAFLETVDPRCTVRVNGVLLTSAARVIQRHAPIGVPVAQQIEIEVPTNVAEGPLLMSIGWEVTRD